MTKERGTHHGMTSLRDHALCRPGVARSDRFGRMLPDLPPLYVDPRALSTLGAAGGPMQASGPAEKTRDVPVGQIFFGQFIDHDITLDLTSSFARIDRPEATANFRTPTLDLDCIYGDGPEGSPFLYWHATASPGRDFNGIKLLTGADVPHASPEQREDLVRSVHGRAIIGDPRNDENRVISQLQLAFLRFHNRVVDTLHERGLRGHALLTESQRLVRWHYQWAVLRDFLPSVAGEALVDDVLGRGRRLYRPECAEGGEPFIPVEFSVAAYRFGHTMIPQRVQVQSGQPALEVFGPTLGFGFSPLESSGGVVDWRQLLDLGIPSTDRADKLDARLAKDLLALPFVQDGEKSLATRNLLRGQAFRLPSGEALARACERPEAEIARVSGAARSLAQAAGTDLHAGTPLWLYVLLEGGEVGRETRPDDFDQGEGLGPVGGRIVVETLVGLLELDPASFLGSNRSWSPMDHTDRLGSGLTRLVDLLTY